MLETSTHNQMVLKASALALAVSLAGCSLETRERSLDGLLTLPISPAQHELIAKRYEEQGHEARAIASRHAASAARYTTWSKGQDEASFQSRGMAVHCRNLASDYERASARYDTLAQQHRALAAGGREGFERDRREDQPEY